MIMKGYLSMTSEEYEIHKTAIKNYLNKFDDIKIRVKSDDKHNREYYQKQAEKLGYNSMNHFVISLMDYAIKNKLTAKKITATEDKAAKK